MQHTVLSTATSQALPSQSVLLHAKTGSFITVAIAILAQLVAKPPCALATQNQACRLDRIAQLKCLAGVDHTSLEAKL